MNFAEFMNNLNIKVSKFLCVLDLCVVKKFFRSFIEIDVPNF